MNQKDLKRLSRRDLLEMLLELSKENEQLRQRNSELENQLADRMLTLTNSGSLAEAVLHLNGVFQAAQEACDQYVYNVKRLCHQAETDETGNCADMNDQ